MTQPQPPKWVNRLLKRTISDSLWEFFEGDLYEIFLEDCENMGPKKARRRYIIHALAFLRYHRLRNNKYSPGRILRELISGKTQSKMELFSNYLKVSWRDLKRHKTFAMINGIGLIAGFAACLLILQYVFHETSFDRFHNDFDRIYRVVNDRFQNGDLVQHGTITYPIIAPTMQQDYPEIEAFTRLTTGGRNYVRFNEQVYLINNSFIADEHFLSFFDFPVIEGSEIDLLKEPFTIVLTETCAERFLQEGEVLSDLIGKSLRVYTSGPPCKITAIVQDPPVNSHLQFETLISYQSMIAMSGGAADNSWAWSDFYHYIKVKEGANVDLLQAKVADFGEQYFKKGEISGSEEEFYLQPLAEAHLYSDYEYEIGATSNGKVVWMMLFIALFIILIAWVNFVNLSTSRAAERALEVGVRKSLGALKGQLFTQFFAEAVLINGIALIVALVIVSLVQEPYKQLTGIPMSFDILWTASVAGVPFLFVFLIIFIGCLLLISVYPAKVLSGFKTTEVIKGRVVNSSSAVVLKKALVIFQFMSAMILITGTVTIYRQISFMQSQELGMNMEHNVVLYGPEMADFDSLFIDHFYEFKYELTKLPGVESVTSSSRVFGQQMARWFQLRRQDDPEIRNLSSNVIQADYAFISQFDIDLLAGRNLIRTDQNYDGNLVNKLILNKTAVKKFQFASVQEAIGKKLITGDKSWEIVGVIDDFHQKSLHLPIEPLMLVPYSSTEHLISVKMASANALSQNLEAVSNLYKQFYPGNYLDYFVLEDNYNGQYRSDQMVQQIAQAFTGIAILIALMGLYGLVLITLNKKTKEIAVRKVLGANMSSIVVLLGKNFLGLICLAIFISIPISYWSMDSWLSGYAYNNGFEWPVLLVAGAVLLLISVMTIYWQTKKVTDGNPADSLKYE